MGMKARLCGLLVVLALGSFLIARGDEPIKIATQPFLPPVGPFSVGTHEYLWIDQNRQDPFTKDPKVRRHLIVRVWYLAQAVAGAEKARYILDVNEFAEQSDYGPFTTVKTNAVTDAPIAKSKVAHLASSDAGV